MPRICGESTRFPTLEFRLNTTCGWSLYGSYFHSPVLTPHKNRIFMKFKKSLQRVNEKDRGNNNNQPNQGIVFILKTKKQLKCPLSKFNSKPTIRWN